MDDDEIILEDWKMTKDRIKHFDDVVMRTRLQGLPIATALQAAAFLTSDTVGRINVNILNLNIINLPVFSLIILAGLVYLIPVILLDAVHFKLLMQAVKHAQKIEQMSRFKEKLGITTALTGGWLTVLHAGGAAVAYFLIIIVGSYLVVTGPQIISNLS